MTTFYLLSRANVKTLIVGIYGFNAIAMVYLNKFSESGLFAGKCHDAICRCVDRCAIGSTHIKTLVHFNFARRRGKSLTIITRDPAVGRKNGRSRVKEGILIQEVLIEFVYVSLNARDDVLYLSVFEIKFSVVSRKGKAP